MVGARGLAAALPFPRIIVPPAIVFGAQEGGLRTLDSCADQGYRAYDRCLEDLVFAYSSFTAAGADLRTLPLPSRHVTDASFSAMAIVAV